MPLMKTIKPAEDIVIGVWQISEPPEYFYERLKLNEHDQAILDVIKTPRRLLEFLASRYLLRVLIGAEHSMVLVKDEYGKPGIHDPACHISISHCDGYAAAMVSDTKRVGIDVEVPSDRIKRVWGRYMNEPEKDFAPVDDVMGATLIWSAKEAVYKLYGKKQLSFSQNILLSEFAEDTLHGHLNLPDEQAHYTVHFETGDYILTYCWD